MNDVQASVGANRALAPGGAAPALRIDDVGADSSAIATDIDRLFHAMVGQFTAGLSPAAIGLAFDDWFRHLLMAPARRLVLLEKGLGRQQRFLRYLAAVLVDPDTPPCITPLPQDRRFDGAGWREWPFNIIHQGFLLHQQWLHNVTTGVRGVSPHHEQVVAFVTRQLLDTVSPVNFLATNPDVLAATVRERGANLVRGFTHFASDLASAATGRATPDTGQFLPGREVAATPGKVVFKNRLIELIQYAPATAEVRAEPVLFVPAWIMKYYILDLSPHNSLVKYLVDRGHTVFMISWHNPASTDRNLDMDAYLHAVLDALRAVEAIVPGQKIHAAGYCLGGTLLTMAAAWLAQMPGQPVLASLTLLAAQTDFTEAGELSLFIDDSQLAYLDDIMWSRGFLDTRQMSGAFQLLRSNDLVWSRVVNEYLMGRDPAMTDLMAWNADTTRMPYKMHSEYLQRFFLQNDLFQGRCVVDGTAVAISNIDAPMFVVATEADHVAPWRSVYKINLAADAEVSFVLTNGGHNAGIVSEPGHHDRRYRLARRREGERYIDPDAWRKLTPVVEGSWWSAWIDWLDRLSTGCGAPPAMGLPGQQAASLAAAPGQYVFEH